MVRVFLSFYDGSYFSLMSFRVLNAFLVTDLLTIATTAGKAF